MPPTNVRVCFQEAQVPPLARKPRGAPRPRRRRVLAHVALKKKSRRRAPFVHTISDWLQAGNKRVAFEVGNTLGRRWAKGTSGNPSGRPRASFDLAEMAKAHGPAMLDVLVSIALDEQAPTSDRVRAAEAVLSRGHGRAVAPHVIAASVEHLDATQVFVAALREHSERLQPALLPTK